MISDNKYGHMFVYCTQHMRVHATGWCAVTIEEKITLEARTLDEAIFEWHNCKLIWLASTLERKV